MKGSVSLNPKYSSLHIKPTRILKSSPLIACDQKHLYFKSTKTDSPVKCIRWEDKAPINCTYLKKQNIILLLAQNYRVYALTQNLQEITSITGWQSNYTLAFQYIEEYGLLLLIGAETVEMLRISIETNVKKTKFLSSIKFNLKKITPQPYLLTSSILWNKGFGLNVVQNLLYVWSPESIAFFQISSHKRLSQSHSLTKKQYPITCCYFSSYFKYTLAGTSCGEIRVWRLPLSHKFHHQNVLIHTFQAHVKPIKQIIESKYSQKIILTSGQDLLVCVWSLQTFEMLRRFQFFGVYGQITVKSIDEAFVTKDGMLGELNFGQSLQFITEVNSNILSLDKQFISTKNDLLTISTLGLVTLTLQQNLGVIFDSSLLLKAKQLNKIQTKFIYPPLKAKSIKQIISSPFVSTTYYLLAENGELFRVQVLPFSKQNTGTTSTIQQVYNIEFTVDKQKHPLNQIPSIVSFLDILPTQFDSEIRDVDDNSGKSYRSNVEQKSLGFNQALDKFYSLKLMTIGCQKGTVVFLSCANMTKIYCRLTYHRDKIIAIQSIKQFKTTDFSPMNGMIATYCAQNYLKLIKFDYKKSTANCFLTYYAGQQLKMIRGFQNFMTVVFYKGEFEVTEVDLKGKTEQFCCRKPSSIDNHEGQILSIDYESKHQLIMTAASDNKIKIWTTKKILLYDVLLDNGLAFSCFIPHLNSQSKIQQQKLFVQASKNNKKIKEQDKNQSINPVDIKIRQLMKRPKPQPVNFDMIILHGQKLLYFHHIPLSFRPNQIQDYNSNPQLLDDQTTTLREVFQNYNHKNIDQQQNNKIQQMQKKIENKQIQRNRVQTQPNSYHQVGKKRFFTEQNNVIDNESYLNLSPILRKGKMKTQTSIEPSLENAQQNQIKYRISQTQKKRQKTILQKNRSTKSQYKSMLQRPAIISQSSIDATKKHIQQLHQLKKQINVNRPFLPKIQNKKEDVFDQFMREKLVNKNVLTRRDITINRIIMKNIIREHFVQESKFAGLRLQY